MRNNTVKVLTIQALLAAIYVVLTVAIAPFSYGAIQFRISESLSQLVVFSINLFLVNHFYNHY